MQAVLSADAARLYLAQAMQDLLPVLGAAEPSGHAWQAFAEVVGAGLNVPAGHSVQPAWQKVQWREMGAAVVTAAPNC
jgi:hypothetical protein